MSDPVKKNNNRPVKVLHFMSSLSVGAGMTNAVLNYHRFIDPSRVQFDYLYMNEYQPSRKEEIHELGGKTYCVPVRGNGLPLSEMRRFFKEHIGEYDVLHCHPIFGPQMLGLFAKQNGIRHVISHSHSTRFSDKPSSAKRNKLLSTVVGLFATDYIACSEDAKVLLGSHAEEAFVMHNAIDCAKYSFSKEAREEIRKSLHISPDVFLLGTLGRLSPEKNQSFMIEICSKMAERGVNAMLVIAGGGPEESRLKEKIATAGLENRVLLLGPRSDGPALYSAFDAFLLTSLFEGLPVSAVEAQASGLPCFLSDSITSEVAFSNGKQLSLDDGAEAWAREIEMIGRIAECDRELGSENVKRRGFDVHSEVELLMRHYELMING